MFESVLDLKQKPAAAAKKLRHGEEAKSAEWPASLYVTFKTSNGTAACTAALVGPEAMLTAAHCVPASATVSFMLAGTKYKTQCEINAKWASDPSADYALCKVEKAVPSPGAGFKFETIDTASLSATPKNRALVLTGYGCISDVAIEDETDGKYRIGSTSIDETSESSKKRRGTAYYSPHQKNNLITTDDPQAPNICPGDSGGPAFQTAGAGYANRSIVGVNSRVFYRDATKKAYGASLISATGGPDFSKWATNWAKHVAKVPVCGVDGTIPNCR